MNFAVSLLILGLPLLCSGCQSATDSEPGIAAPDNLPVLSSSASASASAVGPLTSASSIPSVSASSPGPILSAAIPSATGLSSVSQVSTETPALGDAAIPDVDAGGGPATSAAPTPSSSAPNIEYADGTQAVSDLAAAFCGAARACCTNFAGTTTLDDCEVGYAETYWAADGLRAGTTGAEPKALNRCLAALTAAAVECNRNLVLAACNGVLEGTQPAGAPCHALDLDCQTYAGVSECLITEANSELGVCVAPPRGKVADKCMGTCQAGAACSQTVYGLPLNGADALCFEADGLFCDYNLELPVCKPIHEKGTPCVSGFECRSDGVCISSLEQSDITTCVATASEGQACEPGCHPSLTCISGTCQPLPFADEWICAGYPIGAAP